MNKIIIDDKIQDITPELIAELFCSLGSDGQAAFFNHVDVVADRWSKEGGCMSMQMQYVTEDDGLTLAGRRVMQMIGEYSHWGLSCKLGRAS